MPTFDDPVKDAAEASAALRGLAHATRAFDDPAGTYSVLGDVLAGVRSLRQVLDQLATAHLDQRDQARDDTGNQTAGAAAALAAADELHQAGTPLDGVQDRVDAAMSHSGRIAWHPKPPPALSGGGEAAHATVEAGVPDLTVPADRTRGEHPVSRWVSVVFLQSAEAGEVLDLIDAEGPDAAIDHLTGHNQGEETAQAALENGYVYAAPPAGTLDRTTTRGAYALVHNPFTGYVSLLREHTAPPDESLAPTGAHPLVTAMRTRAATRAEGTTTPTPGRTVRSQAAGADWFAHSPGPTTSRGRGVAL